MYMTTGAGVAASVGAVALVGDGIILGYGTVGAGAGTTGAGAVASAAGDGTILGAGIGLDLVMLGSMAALLEAVFTALTTEEASIIEVFMDVALIEVLPLIDLEEDTHQELFPVPPCVQAVPI